MERLFCCLILLGFFSLRARGQDTVPIRRLQEVYLTIEDYNPLNVAFKYKKQVGHFSYIKLGLLNLSCNIQSRNPKVPIAFKSLTLYYTVGAEVGIEFRRTITNRCTFYNGPNIGFTYKANWYHTYNPNVPVKERKKIKGESYFAEVPYTFGLLFHLKEHFFISAEWNPEISVSWGWNLWENERSVAVNTKLISNTGRISLVYRF